MLLLYLSVSIALELPGRIQNPVVDLLKTAIQEGDDDPCVNKYDEDCGKIDKICEALNENDLTETVGKVRFNIDICHSLTGELDRIETSLLSLTHHL